MLHVTSAKGFSQDLETLKGTAEIFQSSHSQHEVRVAYSFNDHFLEHLKNRVSSPVPHLLKGWSRRNSSITGKSIMLNSDVLNSFPQRLL